MTARIQFLKTQFQFLRKEINALYAEMLKNPPKTIIGYTEGNSRILVLEDRLQKLKTQIEKLESQNEGELQIKRKAGKLIRLNFK